MANNTMLLRCGICGEKSPCLIKYCSSIGWHIYNHFNDRLDVWLYEHSGHGEKETDWTLGPTHFEIVYEHVKEIEHDPADTN